MSILVRIVLAIILLSPVAAFAQASKKVAAPRAIQTEFEAFIATFRAALKANDSITIAGMTRLPFMDDKTYFDAAQFRAKAYPEFFTTKNRDFIQRSKAIYDRDGENNDVSNLLLRKHLHLHQDTGGFPVHGYQRERLVWRPSANVTR